MVDPQAEEGDTVRTSGGCDGAAVYAPWPNTLRSCNPAGRAAALDWLNTYYDRTTTASVPPTGWAFLALMAAITVLSAGLARLLPGGR